MRTVGLSLGLALLCLLQVGAEDLEAAELDKSKIAGKWHITAMASDSKSYLERKDQLKMAMANIKVLGEGDLKVSFAIPTTRWVRPKVIELFKTFAKMKGFTDEMIWILPRQGVICHPLPLTTSAEAGMFSACLVKTRGITGNMSPKPLQQESLSAPTMFLLLELSSVNAAEMTPCLYFSLICLVMVLGNLLIIILVC
ncbi:hypothetical protein BTVI_54973 [Pitangus sulphuratus]|nr:hypothetical protein BTVI_54973 [Pitangus sulphuratus]